MLAWGEYTEELLEEGAGRVIQSTTSFSQGGRSLTQEPVSSASEGSEVPPCPPPLASDPLPFAPQLVPATLRSGHLAAQTCELLQGLSTPTNVCHWKSVYM